MYAMREAIPIDIATQRLGSRRQQCLEFRARVRLAHEGFADEETMHTVGLHKFHILTGPYTAFSYDGGPFRDMGQQFNGRLERGFKCLEIAIVDAQQSRLLSESRLKFSFVMNLDKYVKP